MITSMQVFWFFLFVSQIVVRAQNVCRCEANFERFYARRQPFDIPDRFQLASSYVNKEGYFVVNGVVVLPASECRSASNNRRGINPFLTMFGDRRLEGGWIDPENEVESKPHGLRHLKGRSSTMGMMSGRSNYYYGDYTRIGGQREGETGYYYDHRYFHLGGKRKGKNRPRGYGNPNPCSNPSTYYLPECLPPVFPCTSTSSWTSTPTSAPLEPIATTCPDGSIGPINPSDCANICPPIGEPQPAPGRCQSACPKDGSNKPAGCINVCDIGTDTTPRGCVEACCERDLCVDGSYAPVDKNNCVVLCEKGNENIFNECVLPCPRDGPKSIFCIDICTGSIDDESDCKDSCCPDRPVSNATPSKTPSKTPSTTPTSVPLEPIATTCPDGTVGPVDPAVCLDICPPIGQPQPLDGLCVKRCSFNESDPAIDCVNVCDIGFANRPQGCVEACCEKEICGDRTYGPNDRKNCAIACDESDEDLAGLCVKTCPTTVLESPAPGCICTGGPLDPSDCHEACCRTDSAAPSAVPSRLPSAIPTVKHPESPSGMPSSLPSPSPSIAPVPQPRFFPSTRSSRQPSTSPSAVPSSDPSTAPSVVPTLAPSGFPSTAPNNLPTAAPLSNIVTPVQLCPPASVTRPIYAPPLPVECQTPTAAPQSNIQTTVTTGQPTAPLCPPSSESRPIFAPPLPVECQTPTAAPQNNIQATTPTCPPAGGVRPIFAPPLPAKCLKPTAAPRNNILGPRGPSPYFTVPTSSTGRGIGPNQKVLAPTLFYGKGEGDANDFYYSGGMYKERSNSNRDGYGWGDYYDYLHGRHRD